MEVFMLTEEQRARQTDCIVATADYFMILIRSGKGEERIRDEFIRNMQALLQAQLDEIQGK